VPSCSISTATRKLATVDLSIVALSTLLAIFGAFICRWPLRHSLVAVGGEARLLDFDWAVAVHQHLVCWGRLLLAEVALAIFNQALLLVSLYMRFYNQKLDK